MDGRTDRRTIVKIITTYSAVALVGQYKPRDFRVTHKAPIIVVARFVLAFSHGFFCFSGRTPCVKIISTSSAAGAWWVKKKILSKNATQAILFSLLRRSGTILLQKTGVGFALWAIYPGYAIGSSSNRTGFLSAGFGELFLLHFSCSLSQKIALYLIGSNCIRSTSNRFCDSLRNAISDVLCKYVFKDANLRIRERVTLLYEWKNDEKLFTSFSLWCLCSVSYSIIFVTNSLERPLLT